MALIFMFMLSLRMLYILFHACVHVIVPDLHLSTFYVAAHIVRVDLLNAIPIHVHAVDAFFHVHAVFVHDRLHVHLGVGRWWNDFCPAPSWPCLFIATNAFNFNPFLAVSTCWYHIFVPKSCAGGVFRLGLLQHHALGQGLVRFGET